MNRWTKLATALLLAALAMPGAGRADGDDLASEVNPFIGTLGAGFVFPGPAAPYGMVQLSPDTEGYFAYTGYQWTDHAIRGFSHVHVESMGVPEGGAVPFMPVTGAVSTDVQKYQSHFSHAREEASAGYYKVHLDSYDIDAELTAGLRTGMHRYTFPAGSDAHVIIDAGRAIDGDTPTVSPERIPAAYLASVSIPDDRTVLGTANGDRAGTEHYAVHFAMRSDRPFSGHGVFAGRGADVQPGDSVTGTGAGAVLDFDTSTDREVIVKVGISFVSQANALANLEDELPGDDFDFDALRAKTHTAWNDALHAIEIQGGNPLERTSFYTSLYHVMHHPNVFNDANGQYLGHDGAVHTIGSDGVMPPGSAYYANFSLWDTYRAEMPLLAAVAPDRYRDMMRSLRAVYLHMGHLPRWSLMNRDPGYMIGEPAIQTVADAFCRGLVPADAESDLYDAIASISNGGGSEGKIGEFNAAGFIKGGVGASTTLELASANFALALVADLRGDAATRTTALTRAGYWRNIVDPVSGFARPRDQNSGAYKADPYLPEDSAGFKEGTGWQYTWLAPHDHRGLIDHIGAQHNGDLGVEQRLDEFFSTAAAAVAPHAVAEMQQKTSLYGIAFYGNQYSPANEHDLQAPYIYDWLAPWKTQALSRAYQTLYRDAPDGLPGNDDLGTMSAWFVWSALGFYPEVPGSPVYVTGSPLFPKAVVHLDAGKTFTVEAPAASLAGKYVASATLGTAPLTKPWFTHGDLLGAGGITFEMSPIPNPSWGAASPPPSMSTSPLADFACSA